VAEAVARRMGLAIDWASEGGRQALKACLEQQRKAWRDRSTRDAGESILTPVAPIAPQVMPAQATVKPRKLSEVLDKWKASGDNPSEATVRKKRVSLRLFEEFTQDAPIESLTKEQGGEFAGWLLARCKAQKTAKDHLDGAKALLNSAVGLGWLSVNPWQAHRVKVKKTRPRRPWTEENLRKLFDSTLFKAYQIPTAKHAGGAAAYWVPLLGLYTGARQSDLCQLRTMDVEEEAGGLVIHITADAEDEDEGILGTSTKTPQGRRKLPVHSALMALGFGDYWRDMRQAGHAALFPGVHRIDGRPAGEQFSKWFRTYRAEQGITARYVDFHGLRHTVSTRLMGAGVPDSASNYITGHSGTERGSSGTYKHMDGLRGLMERLSYPELTLARVYGAKRASGE
jgi:integrase